MKGYGLFLILLLILAPAAAFSDTEEIFGDLTVVGGEVFTYRCDDGKIIARYYCLSDGSLPFVRLLFPDGREYTLPQILSASGARFTFEADLTWWVKGEEATVEVRDDDGQWVTLYESCRLEP
jgi:membrane-bound inhibitor of C-type lysozyme